MTTEQRKQLGVFINRVMLIYGRQSDPGVVSMVLDLLAPYDYDKVISAYNDHMRTTNSFPMPAQIIQKIDPIPTPEAQGRELVEKIKHAIGLFGWSADGKAREYLGPLGWKIVQRMGGWMTVCESDLTTNAALIAQARAVAIDQITYGKKLEESVAPQLEHSNKQQQIGFTSPDEEGKKKVHEMVQSLLNKEQK